VAAGFDPDGDCTAVNQTNACLTGSCDGSGVCAVRAEGNPGSPVCTGFFFCDATPGGACPTACVTDADCPLGRFCDDVAAGGATFACLGDRATGDPCVRLEQCVANACTGNVCGP